MKLGRLPPRERQIAEIVQARGEITAAEICAALDHQVSNPAVRSMLGRLEAKNVVRRQRDRHRFIYSLAEPAGEAGEAALRRTAERYFGGSLEEVARVASKLSDEHGGGSAM